MNKKELYTVVVLVLLIPVWLFIDQTFIKPMFPDPVPVATATPEAEPKVPADERTPAAPVREGESLPEVPVMPTRSAETVPMVEEEVLILENDPLRLELSNLGAGIARATLKNYAQTLEDKDVENGQSVVLDFAAQGLPALTTTLPGLAPGAGFSAEQTAPNQVTFQREVQPGLILMRELTLGDRYEVSVSDRWINQGEVPLLVPSVSLNLGPMIPRPEASQRFGPYVSVDAQRNNSVQHYVKKLTKGLKQSSNGTFTLRVAEPVQWFAVKNKFFVQVLTLGAGQSADALEIQAAAGEGDVRIGMAQASVSLAPETVAVGEELRRTYSLYVGPMAMSELKLLGDNQEGLIDLRLFRIFVPIGRAMMTGLDFFHGLVGNWGIAIILLTFTVRMLFWPLTQKGAENMKRMSELSPQMKALREKYKNDPTKLNAEMSKFYKENKVNPMAGCLPMLVQIPVFISLYGTLRVAVDLRFAEFLWIRDLSEQEAIFYIGSFAFNILPLTMAATMILQQKLTPSNMDEQQKKIMTMMPVVFLFITYSMPSGLLLYWTTSNLISIYQTTHTKRRDAKKAAKAAAK
jgi:YidC/Oxa1 family membrane protein insertase